MNKFFSISLLFILSVMVINAQSRSYNINFIKIKSPAKTKAVVTLDSVDYCTGNGALYYADAGGFVTGTNGYGDLGKYQKFTLADNYIVKGYYFYSYIETTVGSPDPINLVIKSVKSDGSPGTTLSTVSKLTSDLAADGWNVFNLATPVTPGKEFFIGLEWNSAADDTFGIVSDETDLGYGDGANRAWEKWSDNTFWAFNDPDDWGMDIDLWIGMIGEKIVSETPVELSSFTANLNGNAVVLNWSTATEKNNMGFEIQRSSDKVNFTKVGYLAGNGTTTQRKTYTFTDNNISSSKVYYRLKQIDYDGAYNLTNIVETGSEVISSFSLDQNYPNPFNPSTLIKYSLPSNSNVRITISNALGEVVKELTNELQQSGVHVVNFNATGLSSGVYFYTVYASSVEGAHSFTASKKMILIK